MARVPQVVQSGEQTVVGNIGGIAESIASLAPGLGQVVDAVEQEEQRRIQIRRKDEFIRLDTQLQIEANALRMDIEKNRGFTNPEQASSAWAAEFPGLMEKYGLQATSPEVEMSIAASGAGTLVDGDSHLRTKFMAIEKDAGIAAGDEATDVFTRRYAEAVSEEERDAIMTAAFERIDLNPHYSEVQKVAKIKEAGVAMQGGRVSSLLANPTPTSLAMANHILDNHKTLLSTLMPEQVDALRIAAERAERQMRTDQRQRFNDEVIANGEILSEWIMDKSRPLPSEADVRRLAKTGPQFEHYMKLLEDHANGVDLNRTDHRVANDLWKGVYDGTTSEQDIIDAQGNGLSRQDATNMLQIHRGENKLFAVEGRRMQWRSFMRQFEADIAGGPLQESSPEGQARYYHLEATLKNLLDDGVGRGKVFENLLDPGHTDYIASPGVINKFKVDFAEQIIEQANRIAIESRDRQEAEIEPPPPPFGVEEAGVGGVAVPARARARRIESFARTINIRGRGEEIGVLMEERADFIQRADNIRSERRRRIRGESPEERQNRLLAADLAAATLAEEVAELLGPEAVIEPDPTSPDAVVNEPPPEREPTDEMRREGETYEEWEARVGPTPMPGAN
jgi:hypothetical protein